jgi:glucose/arabinose dehydrogenase
MFNKRNHEERLIQISMKRIIKIMSGIALIILASEANSQPKAGLEEFAPGFTHPVTIANAGDSRLFIVEQPGDIRIIDSAGNIKPLLFLDISDRVISAGGEQGLLGLAFHPQYSTNGYFYVDYTGAGDSTHISRFSVSPSNPDSAIAGSEMKLMTIYQPYTNHNGGNLIFGPDGYLYIGMGDGGSAGDPENRAQDSLQLLGKLLRIDVNGGSPYGIPPDNPFVGNPAALPEIWALGLRNPWRFSFDRLTGNMWIADVGQNTYEEIDFQPAGSQGGENYGWRCYEGDAPYNTSGCKPQATYVFPIYVYSHSAFNGCSVTGGFVYRGTRFPGLDGLYFFTDYCSDNLWTLHDSAGTWVTTLHGTFSGSGFSTFGEDSSGELYLASLNNGIIYRVIDLTAGIAVNPTDVNIRIYPNPFTDALYVEFNEPGHIPAKLSIFDLQGRQVYKYTISRSNTELDLSSLLPGIYLVHLQSTGISKHEKIVKR